MSTAVLIILFLICVIAIVALSIVYSKNNGELGEIAIAKYLKELPDEYHVINNVVIEKDGFTNQIDHVVVSPYGIFCIETKNMKGDIYGSENAQYWMQNIWGNKYKFFNPLLQNEKHVKALRHELANFVILEIHPITVFTRRAKLHVKVSSKTCLVYSNGLRAKIKSFKERVMNEENAKIIADFIGISEGFQYTKKEEHVSNARQAKLNAMIKERNKVCPRCGGQLVERNGRYGKFIGCSNYPNCKYTDKI